MNRKNLLVILLIGFDSLSFTHSTHDRVEIAYDGDTILLETGKKVRYSGIDAPEVGYEGNRSEFMAIASKNFNFRLVDKMRVRTDGYGRKAKDLSVIHTHMKT